MRGPRSRRTAPDGLAPWWRGRGGGPALELGGVEEALRRSPPGARCRGGSSLRLPSARRGGGLGRGEGLAAGLAGGPEAPVRRADRLQALGACSSGGAARAGRPFPVRRPDRPARPGAIRAGPHRTGPPVTPEPCGRGPGASRTRPRPRAGRMASSRARLSIDRPRSGRGRRVISARSWAGTTSRRSFGAVTVRGTVSSIRLTVLCDPRHRPAAAGAQHAAGLDHALDARQVGGQAPAALDGAAFSWAASGTPRANSTSSSGSACCWGRASRSARRTARGAARPRSARAADAPPPPG